MARKPKTANCRYCHHETVVIAHVCDDICDTCHFTRKSVLMTNSYPFQRGRPSEIIGLGKDNRNQHLINQVCDALSGRFCLSCGDQYDMQGWSGRIGDMLVVRLVCQCHESHDGFALFDARDMSLCDVYSDLDKSVIFMRARK